MQKRTQLEKIMVGLDIGTTKICTVVGEFSNNEINIIGIGTHPSIGLKKGVVVDIESTVDSIKKAVKEAELMAGCKISSVYAGIAGEHITSFNSHGITAIKNKEITKADIDRVLTAAKTIAIPTDKKIIHTLPQGYIVDNQIGIQNPVGMAGVRLEAKTHMITGTVTSVKNIIKCANKAGLKVCDIVLESLASGKAVLTKEEKELGSALIDLGGGTSNLAVFKNKNINHTFVLPLGGNNLTNDIAIVMQTSLKDAETLKKKFGSCNSRRIDIEETIQIQKIGGQEPKTVPRQILSEILRPRMEEIFHIINKEICKTTAKKLITSGIVLSGGTSLLDGIVDVAESHFELPTRIGTPNKINSLTDTINNPIYATGIGLVLYGLNKMKEKKITIKDKNIVNRLIYKMKHWFVNT